MRANGGLRFGETIRTGEEAPRFVAGYTDIRTVWRDVQVPGATVATSDAVRKSEAIAARKQRAVQLIVAIGDDIPVAGVGCLDSFAKAKVAGATTSSNEIAFRYLFAVRASQFERKTAPGRTRSARRSSATPTSRSST